MAGNSQQREHELEQMRTLLGRVDGEIQVPDTLRGAALLHKLEDVYPTQAAAPNRKSGLRFSSRWLSLQSGFSYAAAFVLIVALFYGLGFNQQPQIVDGSFTVDQPSQESEEASVEPRSYVEDELGPPDHSTVVGGESGGNSTTGGSEGVVTGGGGAPNTFQDDGAPESGVVAGDSGMVAPRVTDNLPPEQVEPDNEPPQPVDNEGVGGSGETMGMMTHGEYTYAWRSNDPSDPDKEGYALTVDVVENESTQVIAQIDIPDMDEIEMAFQEKEQLYLVGASDEAMVTRVYDVANVDEIVTLAVAEQPGAYVDSRIYKDYLHLITYSDDEELVDGESEALPDSEDAGVVTITTINLQDGSYTQQSFVGAGEEVSLHNVNAYITYDGVDEDGESVLKVAQIRLEDGEIFLGSVS